MLQSFERWWDNKVISACNKRYPQWINKDLFWKDKPLPVPLLSSEVSILWLYLRSFLHNLWGSSFFKRQHTIKGTPVPEASDQKGSLHWDLSVDQMLYFGSWILPKALVYTFSTEHNKPRLSPHMVGPAPRRIISNHPFWVCLMRHLLLQHTLDLTNVETTLIGGRVGYFCFGLERPQLADLIQTQWEFLPIVSIELSLVHVRRVPSIYSVRVISIG